VYATSVNWQGLGGAPNARLYRNFGDNWRILYEFVSPSAYGLEVHEGSLYVSTGANKGPGKIYKMSFDNRAEQRDNCQQMQVIGPMKDR